MAEQTRGWALTHVGNVRTNNEDAAYINLAQQAFAVSDGMGGAAAGEVASSMIIDSFHRFIKEESARTQEQTESPTEETQREILEAFQHSIQRGHEEIVARQKKERDKRGMGCTFTGLLLSASKAHIAHAGDSRIYLLRNTHKEKIQLLTSDHNMAQLLLLTTDLTPEQVRKHKKRNVLTNAIGVTAPLQVDLLSIDIMPEDRFLLCSDGLHEYFHHDAEIAEVLDQFPGEAGCHELMRLALERGGHDNITVVLVEVQDVGLPIIEGDVCDITDELETFSHVRSVLNLTRPEFLRFLSVTRTRTLQDGEWILTPDDTEHGYLVLKGALQKEGSDTIRKEGAMLGARFLASGKPPKKAWSSVGESRVLALERTTLRRLCLTQPTLGARILWGILELD
jgi:serine/threonine protein phosphatase PrpC